LVIDRLDDIRETTVANPNGLEIGETENVSVGK
jgi:hypothetical protein